MWACTLSSKFSEPLHAVCIYIVAPRSKCSHYDMNLQACVINTEDFDSDGVGSGPHLQSVSDDGSLYYKEYTQWSVIEFYPEPITVPSQTATSWQLNWSHHLTHPPATETSVPLSYLPQSTYAFVYTIVLCACVKFIVEKAYMTCTVVRVFLTQLQATWLLSKFSLPCRMEIMWQSMLPDVCSGILTQSKCSSFSWNTF